MAQLNLTLDQNDIRKLLNCDKDGAFTNILMASINRMLGSDPSGSEAAALMEIIRSADTTGQPAAVLNTLGEAGAAGANSVAGMNTSTAAPLQAESKRSASTAIPGDTFKIGTIPLKIPANMNEPFRSLVLHNYSLSEAGIISTAATMVSLKCANRASGRFIRAFCGDKVPQGELNQLCEDITGKTWDFRARPLNDDYPFVTFGAVDLNIRKGSDVSRMPLLLALGVNSKGRRDLLGYTICEEQDEAAWTVFLRSLKARGLETIRMYISAKLPGLREAMTEIYPATPWQRCQIHTVNDILALAPEEFTDKLREELKLIYRSATADEAARVKDDIVQRYSASMPEAMRELSAAFADTVTTMILPESIRRSFHTTTRIEGIIKELLRRSAAVGPVPDESTLDRLMGSYLIEKNEQLTAMNRIFFRSSYDEMEKCIPALRECAATQRRG